MFFSKPQSALDAPAWYLTNFSCVIWLSVAACIVFIPSLSFDYTYLDDNVLLINFMAYLKKAEYLKKVFLEDVFHNTTSGGAYYRPILNLSFMFDVFISGGKVSFFHLMNMMYHIIAICLFFYTLISLKVNKLLALLFSLIFSVHPLMMQAVVWIPGRNDSILAIFVLSSFLSFLRHFQSGKKRLFVLGLVFFTLALFTKENAVCFFPFILLYFLLIEKVPIQKLRIPSIIMGLIILFWLIFRFFALGGIKSGGFGIDQLLGSFIQNSPALLAYLGKFFIPIFLSVFPIIQDLTIPIVIGGGVMIIIAWAFYKSARQNRIWMILGLIWFLGFISPGIIKPNVLFPDFSEHRTYLANFGLILMVIKSNWLESVFLKFKNATIVTLIFILFIFGGMTFMREKVFQNRETFWTDAISTSPNHPFNNNSYGAMLYMKKQYRDAEVYFKKALIINPKEPLSNGNMGLVCMNTQRYDEAEKYFKREIEIFPFRPLAFFNLGLLYSKENRWEDAAIMWEKTIQNFPYYPDSYRFLIYTYTMQKKENDLKRVKELAIKYEVNY